MHPQMLETTVDADPASLAISNQPRGNETLVSTLAGRDLKSLGLRWEWVALADLVQS
jgi:nuclear protein localization family protein 4